MKPSQCLLLCNDPGAAAALLRDLAKQGVTADVALHGSSADPDSRYATRVFRTERTGTVEDLARFASGLDASNHYRWVIATAELWLAALATLEESHPLKAKAALASSTSLNALLSTEEAARCARDSGLTVVEARVLPRGTLPEPPLPFPFLLRTVNATVATRDGLLVPGVSLCRGRTAYEDFLENLGSWADTQALPVPSGRLVKLLCVCAKGELRFGFASEPLHMAVPGGRATYSRSIPCEELFMKPARILLRALDWHGPATLDFHIERDQPAGLLGASAGWESMAPLAIAAGVPITREWLRLSDDPETTTVAPGYRSPLYIRIPADDLDWLRSRRVHPGRGVRETTTRAALTSITRLLSGQEVWEGFSLSDPKPGIHVCERMFMRMWRGAIRRIKAPFQLRAMQARHRRNAAEILNGLRGGTLMFVCHGNICRSPLAEYLAKQRLPGWRVHSTGLHAHSGSRSPGRIRRIGLAFGVNLDPHRSTLIDNAAVAQADAILIMDGLNYRDFADRFPEAMDKLLFLGMFGSSPSLSIPDPVDMETAEARASAEQLADAMSGFVRWLDLKGLG